MAETSSIEWTGYPGADGKMQPGATFNPWEGCTMCSPGCFNCYALARNKRFAGGANWGKGALRKRTSVANWRQPLKWNREAATLCVRPRVFCASLADWLDDEVPVEWLADLLDLIRQTPNLDWLLLTKRPQNWRDRLWAASLCAQTSRGADQSLLNFISGWVQFGQAPANVWLGTTAEDQARADERIPLLLSIPARVRFLSCEPLLEPVALDYRWLASDTWPPLYSRRQSGFHDQPGGGIHWVIIGGESGPGARPFDLRWARSLVEKCQLTGVAPFVKQLGSNPIGYNGTAPLKLKDKKGGDWSEWPEDLRVREFPTVLQPA